MNKRILDWQKFSDKMPPVESCIIISKIDGDYSDYRTDVLVERDDEGNTILVDHDYNIISDFTYWAFLHLPFENSTDNIAYTKDEVVEIVAKFIKDYNIDSFIDTNDSIETISNKIKGILIP